MVHDWIQRISPPDEFWLSSLEFWVGLFSILDAVCVHFIRFWADQSACAPITSAKQVNMQHSSVPSSKLSFPTCTMFCEIHVEGLFVFSEAKTHPHPHTSVHQSIGVASWTCASTGPMPRDGVYSILNLTVGGGVRVCEGVSGILWVLDFPCWLHGSTVGRHPVLLEPQGLFGKAMAH